MKKKACNANATKRDGATRFQSERGSRSGASDGATDARGRTHRLKNLDLYLDLSKERVARYVGDAESPEGAGISAVQS